jgi:hypothetical protein
MNNHPQHTTPTTTPRKHHRTRTGILAALTSLCLLTTPTTALAHEGLGLINTFSEPGSGQGQLAQGSGIAINAQGDVYVADTGNNRIEWFNAAGKYEGQFNGAEINGAHVPAAKEAPAKLHQPERIAVDDDPSSPSYGDVYVDVGGSGRGIEGAIDKFSATGEYLDQISTVVSSLGANGVSNIATDTSGNLWVITEFGPVAEFNNAADNTFLKALSSPSGPTGFKRGGLAVDSEGNLYAGAPGSAGYKFSQTGAELGQLCSGVVCEVRALAIDPVDNDLFIDEGPSISEYGPFGEPFDVPVLVSKPDALVNGAGIAVSPTNGDLYATDSSLSRIDVFAPGSAPETPETLPATELKGKSAILHGMVKPAATKLEYYFKYNTGSSCAGGSKTSPKEGEGEVSEEVTGLEPSAEYTVCFVTENAYGLSEGPPESFTTLAGEPEVIRESAFTPELEGRVVFSAVIEPSHSAQETTYYFEYSLRATGETLEGPVETAAGEGTIPAGEFGERTVSSSPAHGSGLGETVYYRVVATNGSGEPVMGKVQAYTKLPVVFSESSSGLTLTEATLEAEISSDFKGTGYIFEYATSDALLEEGKGTQVSGGFLEGNGGELEEAPVSVVVSGLTPNTHYYYRAVAENAYSRDTGNINKGKPIAGKIEQLTTESVPFVGTGEAGNLTRTTVTLSGTVTPIDQETTYYFQYISEANYQAALAKGLPEPYAESEATVPVSLSASPQPQAAGPALASGLLPGTIYHYRIAAKNEFGVEYGEGRTFTTAGKTLPGVSTGSVSGVTQTAATLSGTVATNGLATSYGFEIATQPGAYGPMTGLGSLGGATTETVTLTLDELQPATTYYYRVTATNGDGTSQGEAQSFTTPGLPVLLTPQAEAPLIAYAGIAFPAEEPASGTPAKALTAKQKLAKALKQCKKDKHKSKRAKCEQAAHKKHPTPKKKRKK